MATLERNAFLRRIFPKPFKDELFELVPMALPIVLCAFFTFLPTTVSIMFCGHLGKNELDAVALANSMLNITGIFICTGLVTACDTLFSQAYGRNDLKTIGICFQRGLILVILSCFICWSVHLNAEYLLILLHQDPAVSRLAAEYMLFFMPGLLFNFLFQICVKYLQTQNRVVGTAVIGFIGNLINAALQYLLIYTCSLQTRGSAIAQSISWFVMCVSIILYIRFCGILKTTWPGWSWRALDKWGSFMKLALAGLVMLSAEWCTFEGGIILNGVLGVVQQGAIGVSFQLIWGLYMVILGISIACSIRVGQHLGAGDTDGAKTSYRVSQIISTTFAVTAGVLLIIFRHQIPYAFASDPVIADLVTRIIPYVSMMHCMENFSVVSSGAIRGCGLQWIGGVINFVEYICVAIPAVLIFTLYYQMGALGFWRGLMIAVVLGASTYIVVIARIDWQKQAEKAMRSNEESVPLSNSPIKSYDGESKEALKSSPSGKEGKSKTVEGEGIVSDAGGQDEWQQKRAKILVKCIGVSFVVLLVFVTGLVTRLLTGH